MNRWSKRSLYDCDYYPESNWYLFELRIAGASPIAACCFVPCRLRPLGKITDWSRARADVIKHTCSRTEARGLLYDLRLPWQRQVTMRDNSRIATPVRHRVVRWTDRVTYLCSIFNNNRTNRAHLPVHTALFCVADSISGDKSRNLKRLENATGLKASLMMMYFHCDNNFRSRTVNDKCSLIKHNVWQ